MKYKYNLSYKKNDIFIPIEINNISGKSLKIIDGFTSVFENEDSLLTLLKMLGKIPNDVDKIYITHTDEINNITLEQMAYGGDVLLFNKDYKKLNKSYIPYMFELFKQNLEEFSKLCDLYVDKYTLPAEKKKLKKYTHFNKMLDRVNKIRLHLRRKEYLYFDTGAYLEEIDFEKDLDIFIKKEFYIDTKDGIKINYSNLRDFIIKVKYALGKLDINKKEDYALANEKQLKAKRLILEKKDE